MRTVQMTLDPDLVAAVDSAARKLGTTRSAFTRQALRDALRRMQTAALEERQRAGYARKPARRREFGVWEREQVWVD